MIKQVVFNDNVLIIHNDNVLNDRSWNTWDGAPQDRSTMRPCSSYLSDLSGCLSGFFFPAYGIVVYQIIQSLGKLTIINQGSNILKKILINIIIYIRPWYGYIFGIL